MTMPSILAGVGLGTGFENVGSQRDKCRVGGDSQKTLVIIQLPTVKQAITNKLNGSCVGIHCLSNGEQETENIKARHAVQDGGPVRSGGMCQSGQH